MQLPTFAELGLSAKVLAAIEAVGYTTPTPIQAEAIPVAMTGRDVLGIAQTGTGKTAGFVLPMLARLESGRARARMPRSLILLPTRELATQVAKSFETYGINHKLDLALLIGGVSMDDQVKKLDRGVDVLIATPGRLLDHFGRGRIMLMGVEILVIDEADRMLDMGFIPDIEKICKLLPPKRQTLFFSATMPPEITRLVGQFLNDPVRIEVAKPATAATTITQRFVYCPDGEDWAKREALRALIRGQPVQNAIIFCNRKRDVAILHKSLVKHGFNAGALHGDMDQSARTATLDAFRQGKITILAASDVAARGLDIPEVSHVFNFDVPWQADDYVHRIGRTGRAGREGYSVTIVTGDDFRSVEAIEKLTGNPLEWLGEVPSAEVIAEGGRRRGRGARGRGAPRGGDRRGAERQGRDTRPPRRERSRGPDREPSRLEPPAEVAAAPAREERRERRPERPRRERRPEAVAQPREVPREVPREAPREAPPQRRRPETPAPQPVAFGTGSYGDGARPGRSSQPRRDGADDRSDRSGGEPRKDSRQEPRKKQPDAPVFGMSEHVPAFLRRPARVVSQ